MIPSSNDMPGAERAAYAAVDAALHTFPLQPAPPEGGTTNSISAV